MESLTLASNIFSIALAIFAIGFSIIIERRTADTLTEITNMIATKVAVIESTVITTQHKLIDSITERNR